MFQDKQEFRHLQNSMILLDETKTLHKKSLNMLTSAVTSEIKIQPSQKEKTSKPTTMAYDSNTPGTSEATNSPDHITESLLLTADQKQP